jgi:dTMP kinase
MTRGRFVAFEGIDGSGKSTQARRVAAARDALYTVEPGGTALGVELRRWLLDASTPWGPVTEALLMLADRAQHVAEVIEPALTAGQSVISDRFAASTLAYQGYGGGVDRDALWSATTMAIGTCVPDLTVLVDVPVEVAKARRSGTDRFEREGDDFFHDVRRGFLELAAAGGAAWVVVDGSLSLDEVAWSVDDALDALGWSP